MRLSGVAGRKYVRLYGKSRIIKGEVKGICGRVVGVYTDGRYDINVIKPHTAQPKQMVIKIIDCEKVR